MPLYEFRNKKTLKSEEHLVPMSQLEEFGQSHPELERVFTPIMLSQRINARSKIDSGFKEVLNKAKKAHPLGTIDV